MIKCILFCACNRLWLAQCGTAETVQPRQGHQHQTIFILYVQTGDGPMSTKLPLPEEGKGVLRVRCNELDGGV
jgi:hypothetical protein